MLVRHSRLKSGALWFVIYSFEIYAAAYYQMTRLPQFDVPQFTMISFFRSAPAEQVKFKFTNKRDSTNENQSKKSPSQSE